MTAASTPTPTTSKTLPVPPLRQTLDRYLETVAVLLSPEELEVTRGAVEAFASGDGPACQSALEAFAAEEDALGRSWLWEAWLEAYHVTRVALPLSSNVGFELAMPTTGSGLDRAAELVHRMAAAYLAHLRGDAGADVSPRGEPLCQQQWDHVEGGLRDPRQGLDVFLPGRQDAADREVVALWRGRAVAVGVSDTSGEPLSVTAIRAGLDEVVALPEAEGPGFTAAGYLAGDDAAAMLAELQQDGDNAHTYSRLREALFLIALTDSSAEASEVTGSTEVTAVTKASKASKVTEATEAAAPEDGADTADHLRQVAFAPGLAWPFKPVTLQVDLADDFTGLHLEHSTLDGSTLVAILGRAQDVTLDQGGPHDEPASTEPLAWVLSTDQRAALEQGVGEYAREADRQRVRILRVPAGPLPTLPVKVSMDACLQAVMLYAQLRTYGRVRSTYESVDMREYQGGRTECLRPNTRAAVELASALVDGTATPDLLLAHLDSHRTQVKRCKSGQGIDRHLFGLRLMADRHGYAVPLHDDPAYGRLTTDFLSTTSLGDPSRIVRAAFAATSEGGIGIYYVPLPDQGVVEFTLSWTDGVAEHVGELEQALADGVAALWSLLEDAAG